MTAHNDVIQYVDIHQLPGPDKIARDADVRIRWMGITARMVVLCGAPVYVQSPIGGTVIDAGSTTGGVVVNTGDVRPPTDLSPAVRVLKIEADGDAWKGLIKPKIRLMGQWLERAGFRPGHHVQVTCVAPGIIELRSSDTE